MWQVACLKEFSDKSVVMDIHPSGTEVDTVRPKEESSHKSSWSKYVWIIFWDVKIEQTGENMNLKVSSREMFSEFPTLSVDKYSMVDLLQIGFCKYIPTWPSFALCPGRSNEAPMATENLWFHYSRKAGFLEKPQTIERRDFEYVTTSFKAMNHETSIEI